MPSLRSIANEYHHAANRIAARADRAGELTESQKKAIESFRDAASKIEALIRPDSAAKEPTQVEGATPVILPKKLKAHKAATPQELLEKANG